MSFTFTYEGDNGVDVLAEALSKLVEGGTGPQPWVIELTRVDETGGEVKQTVGLIGVIHDSPPYPGYILVTDYDTSTHTFDGSGTSVDLSTVTAVTVV